MYKIIFFAITTSFFVPALSNGQERESSQPSKRTRVIVTDEFPVKPQTPRKVVIVPSAGPTDQIDSQTPPARPENDPVSFEPTDETVQPRTLSYAEIQSKLEEAKRQMRTSPLRISLNDESQTTSIVRIAFHNWNTNEIDYLVMSKPLFLEKDSSSFVKTESGQTVRVHTIRGNGVNTPVMIFDLYNRAHLPLIVQYPIEKFGRFREMAYYVSTHPGIVTPETVGAGQTYVRNVLDVARAKLRAKGIFIQPKVADIAERLALVEHVDHYRFRTEYQPRIYNDVYALYAFNRGQTYRYSVSSAGAGGMIQMIPATYRMIRSRYYQIGLMPDFVSGMRNHSNAAQAMLLYMQMTWNDLLSSSTIREAMENGYATQEQLMAAGYNSNPSRLSGYIRRGGPGWTSLIPRETKIYLQIFDSVERYVPMRSRTR